MIESMVVCSPLSSVFAVKKRVHLVSNPRKVARDGISVAKGLIGDQLRGKPVSQASEVVSCATDWRLWRAHGRAVLLGWSSIAIVLLGWSSTVLGTSNHTRVFTAVVVHCGTSTLQQHRPRFPRKEKKDKHREHRTCHNSSTAAVVHTPRIE